MGYQDGVVTTQPGAMQPPQHFIQDPFFLAKLEKVQNYEIRQANVILEAATAQIWPNTYVISDSDLKVPVVGHRDNVMVSNPLFIVKEESSCCARAFCTGNQALLAKVYHSKDNGSVQAGDYKCGCCYTGHRYEVDYEKGPVMTLERDGCCCGKWLGCFACTEFCQNDMYMHAGDFSQPPGTTKPGGSYFGRSVQPLCNGWIPTLNLTTGHSEDPFAVVEGPCVFGGWKGYCCGDLFTVSSQPGRGADLGRVHKREARTTFEKIMRLCTNVDIYDFAFTDKYKILTPENKATVLGNVMHIDYMFFENDWPPIACKPSSDGKSVVIYCTFFECYYSGCICPCQCCIALGGGDN
jgi:hypothetical protein